MIYLEAGGCSPTFSAASTMDWGAKAIVEGIAHDPVVGATSCRGPSRPEMTGQRSGEEMGCKTGALVAYIRLSYTEKDYMQEDDTTHCLYTRARNPCHMIMGQVAFGIGDLSFCTRFCVSALEPGLEGINVHSTNHWIYNVNKRSYS